MTPKLEVTSDPSPSILHTMAGRLQMLGHRSRKPRIPGFARSGVAVVLQCCGRVAVVLRWSGQWSQSMARSVVWSGGPVSGLVGGLVCGVADGLCSLWSVETRPAPYSGLPASNAWILVKGLLFFCNLCNSQKPTRVRAHFAHKMWSALLPPAYRGPRRSTRQHSYKPGFLDTMVILGSMRVCASTSWRLKRS